MNYKRLYTVEEAKRKLERYCAYQERCHQEIDKKLAEMHMIPIAKEEIILHLMKHDFLNEERFSRSFARGKFSIKKWGKQRIVRELKSRAISEYNIKKAIAEINEEAYQKTFNELSDKRFAEIREINKYKKRKKLADYLLYRGWESDLVYKKVTELIP